MQNPTYGSVCGGDGHTEAIKIVFDPSVVKFQQLLEMFASLHDMTGFAFRAQYKSAIFYTTPEQEMQSRQFAQQREATKKKKVTTAIEPLTSWADAEEYHQQYYAKKSNNGGSCRRM
eukprot:c5605_g1_i2.p1 GENE.c5605_g1_i2~~c5605_g1_i2.p1  ORF type:complete len:117 (-),score=29.01 c5605_g1_i2:83-433(-)